MQIVLGLLVMRVILGLTFMGHGSQKLFGWFGGGGWQGALKMVGGMGLRPAWFWALVSGLSEFAGGLLVFLGFLSPLGSLGIIASMLTAIVKVHWRNGFWNSKRGVEFPLLSLATALALALTGPGPFSLDAALHIALPEPVTLIAGLVVVVAGFLAQELTRAPVETHSTSTGQGER